MFVLVISSCKEAFIPQVIPMYTNLLVVEGYLNIGGITTFTLSRTSNLQDWRARLPEADAKIEIQIDGEGTINAGVSDKDGRCVLATQQLNTNGKYRVKIVTADGKAYQTDFLEAKVSPQIDAVNFDIENNGFRIYVNTHDSSNNTRFYSWNFRETWEIRSPVESFVEFKEGRVVNRDRTINISRCWQGNASSEILLSSTERLSEDRISLAPITFIPGNSIKLSQLYSILVTQYPLTKGAYQYLENMKKNTETIGTIFDPQPSDFQGNIKSVTDPFEKVIGWVAAGTVSEKRIFIRSTDRPKGWSYQQLDCEVKDVPADSVAFYSMSNYLIYNQSITGYIMARSKCIDCRLQGSNISPVYWPE